MSPKQPANAAAKSAVSPSAAPLPDPVQIPDIADAYQKIYDLLGQAYWEASDIQSKDLVHGVQEAIADILTQLDQDDLATNTQAFVALQPKLKSVNDALTKIKAQVDAITKNISTAAAITSAIAKVLSLVPSILPA